MILDHGDGFMPSNSTSSNDTLSPRGPTTPDLRLQPQQPAISVLLTVYNGLPYLAEAIDSILNQSFGDFELVIVDDGSTDESLDVLRDYERRDPRVRLFQRPHLGIVPAANFGLKQCRGEFLARMDSDDVALPVRFEAQVRAMREDPTVAVVGGTYELVDAAGRLLRTEYPPQDDATLQELALRGLTPIPQPLAMMRMSMVRQVGEYDPIVETAEDNDMWLRLGEVGKLVTVPQTLLKYRQHDKSVSEVKAVAQADRIRIGCEKAYRRRKLRREFVQPPAWRPTGEGSRYRFLLQYGWWAFNNAQRKTAMVYALKVVQKKPLSSEPWNLLYASAIKPLPEPPKPRYQLRPLDSEPRSSAA